MVTAHRRRRIPVKKRKIPFGRIIFAVLIFLAAFFFFRWQTKFWDGSDKLSLVINNSPDSILVVTFDPSGNQITTITIPGQTQVDVARGLGVWRLKSIWQLGIDEHATGSLLSETITKNFDFPVFAWADSPGQGFIRGGLSSLFSAVFTPYKTNMGIGDKIKIAMFTLGIKNIDRNTINLASTDFLKAMTFKEGDRGYAVSDSIPPDLAAIFSDKSASLNLKTEIKDGTGEAGVAQSVGEIVEVLGPKVAQIAKGKVEVSGCRVSGKYRQLVIKVARIFGCTIGQLGRGENFDIILELGENFPNKF